MLQIAELLRRPLETAKYVVEPFGRLGLASFAVPTPDKDHPCGIYYNDVDRALVNMLLQFRDHGNAVLRALRRTPFSRDGFLAAVRYTDTYARTFFELRTEQETAATKLAWAVATATKLFQSRNCAGIDWDEPSGKLRNGAPDTVGDWLAYVRDTLPATIKHMLTWSIDACDCFEYIEKMQQQLKGKPAIFCMAPPLLYNISDVDWLPSYHMDQQDHIRLLHLCKGMDPTVHFVMLLSRPNGLYDAHLRDVPGWHRVDSDKKITIKRCDGEKVSTCDCFYLNYELESQV